MATTTTGTKKTVQVPAGTELPKGLQPPAAPTPPVDGNSEGGKKGKKGKRESLPVHFDSEEAAVQAASERTKGPRRAFKVMFQDQVWYVVHNNDGRALGAAFEKYGATAEELGKGAKKSKLASEDAIFAAINALPEEKRAAVLAKLNG
jgi:hypothetical protein